MLSTTLLVLASSGSVGLAAGSKNSASTTTSFVLEDLSQTKMQGCEIEGSNPTYLRSGSAKQDTSATLILNLQPGGTITGASFAYNYVTGYHGTVGANFSLEVANTAAYASPLLNQYECSPAITAASADGISIAVPPSGAAGVAFKFHNIDKNIQIELPLQINITCVGMKLII
eukprot:gene4194-23241_t